MVGTAGCSLLGRHLRKAESRDSHPRSASESYRRDSDHSRSLAVRPPSRDSGIGPHLLDSAWKRRCAAMRMARLAFVRATFVPRGIAKWHARVD